MPCILKAFRTGIRAPTILLRESYREDGKVKKRTLANLSRWPEHLVKGLRTLLRGGVAVEGGGGAVDQAFPAARPCRHHPRYLPKRRIARAEATDRQFVAWESVATGSIFFHAE